MNKEDIFDKEQLEILLNNLQDIDKFTGFKDGAFKYELGKYQANLLVNCIKKYKEVIDKLREYLTSYSSIHTIQFGTENDSLNDIELNKTLDEKTLNEMTNRYLKVHDKLLDILKEVE